MVKDYLGNTYNTIKDMCDHYGISQSLYAHRKSRGYTPKECVLGKIRAQDHKGNIYGSIKEMCEHYNISVPLYKARMERGITGEDLFKKGRLEQLPKDNIVDFNGIKYSSIAKMCRKYGINRSTYIQRIEKGMSNKEALTIKPLKRKTGCRCVTDHKGNSYATKKEMCDTYGIKPITLTNRLKLGWTLEDALTFPVSKRRSG